MFDGLYGRIDRHLRNGTTDCAPSVEYRPASAYTDGKRFESEMAEVFRKRPLAVGSVESVAKPGDFISRNFLGTSFFIWMGEDGVRRAFLNTCRHRGSELIREASGHACRRVQCPYHAWTYDSRGKLAGLPHASLGFAGVPRDELGLVELKAFSAFGLLWVVLDDASGATPPSYFEGIARELDHYGVGEYAVFHSRREMLDCNWKAAVENFLEGYHIGGVHARTVGRKVCDNLTLYDRFGEHSRIIFPLLSVRGAGPPTKPEDLLQHLSVNYFLFPSTVMLFVGGAYALRETFTPISTGKTQVDRAVLIPRLPRNVKERATWKKVASFFDRFVAEDYRAIENVQRGLVTAGDRDIVFGRFEQGIADLHRTLEEMLRGPALSVVAGARTTR